MVRTMRKLEAKNIAPESEGALEIRNRNAGVISCEDVKGHVAENVQRPTPNVQRRILGSTGCQPVCLGNLPRLFVQIGLRWINVFGKLPKTAGW
jgi:hypothetical protein